MVNAYSGIILLSMMFLFTCNTNTVHLFINTIFYSSTLIYSQIYSKTNILKKTFICSQEHLARANT